VRARRYRHLDGLVSVDRPGYVTVHDDLELVSAQLHDATPAAFQHDGG
jgi:hypothetical protein